MTKNQKVTPLVHRLMLNTEQHRPLSLILAVFLIDLILGLHNLEQERAFSFLRAEHVIGTLIGVILVKSPSQKQFLQPRGYDVLYGYT